MIGDLSFLKGNIQPIILNSLYNGDKYGYEIAREIKEKTANNYEIKQPTLYSYLKKLEKDSLIESYWGAESNGGRRRYYRLTTLGRATFEQYTAQWSMQREVMDTLVDATTDNAVDAEIDTTLLLGNKEKKPRKKRTVSHQDIEEQDQLATRLANLTATDNKTAISSDNVAEETVNEKVVATTESSNQEEAETTLKQLSSVVSQDSRAKFELHQESVETFMQMFDQHASQITHTTTAINDDYKATLFDIVGDALDDVDTVQESANATQYQYNANNSAQLEDIADALAKSSIRMRIYNANTAVYRSKKLMPFSKILCATSWLTYAVFALCMGVVALLTVNADTTSNIIIVAGIALLLPLAGSIFMTVDPTRKVVKQLNYRLMYTLCIVGWFAFVTLLLAINTLFLSIKFDNVSVVVSNIVIPSVIAIMPLFGCIFFAKLSKPFTN